MSFTYDPTTDAGRVRLLISDRDADDFHFRDAEIDTFLALAEGDVYVASADALDSWAASLATTAHDVQLGNYREMTHHAAREMRETAKRLREMANTRPAIAIGEKAWDGAMGWSGRDILTNRALRGGL